MYLACGSAAVLPAIRGSFATENRGPFCADSMFSPICGRYVDRSEMLGSVPSRSNLSNICIEHAEQPLHHLQVAAPSPTRQKRLETALRSILRALKACFHRYHVGVMSTDPRCLNQFHHDLFRPIYVFSMRFCCGTACNTRLLRH